MSWLAHNYFWIEWTIRLVMLLVVLRRRFSPVTSLAWLAVIFLQPTVGLVLYLLLGDHRLARKRVKRYQRVIVARRPDEPIESWQAHMTRPDIEPAQRNVIHQAERITGMPILGGNQLELLAEARQTIQRMIGDIDAAQHHVHMVFYIFRPDGTGRRVIESLCRAAARGVRCRLLADAAGSRLLFNDVALIRALQEAGVEVRPALAVAPLRRRLARVDLRNHRKLLVIDGAVAFTGSQNIVDADYGHRRVGQWIDMMGRFTGPVVAQFQSVFVEDWYFETDEDLTGDDIFPPLRATGVMPAQAVPTGPGEDQEAFQRVLLSAINAAQRKLIITSPYLVPDEPTLVGLEMAAGRGVEVHLVLPRKSDHPLVDAATHAYFDDLLDAGVHVHLHQQGLLHAKTMTVDDAFALLGSSNMDVRSFYLNFELNVLMYGPQITGELRFAQNRYLSESLPLDAAAWRRRPTTQRYAQSAAKLLSPLL